MSKISDCACDGCPGQAFDTYCEDCIEACCTSQCWRWDELAALERADDDYDRAKED